MHPPRRDLDEFWQQLQEVEGRLDGAAGSATGQRGRLDRLSQELQELNSTATRLRGQLGTVVGTGFGGKKPPPRSCRHPWPGQPGAQAWLMGVLPAAP